MFYFNRKLFLLVIIFALTCKFCSGQAQVSENAPNDLTDHLLNLDLQNLLHFTVTASDGKMSRIDVVSDSASAWSHGATGTNTATFTGVPNQGKAGTYRPQFSGEVTKDGQGKGDPKKYDWAAKAKYELPGEFQILLKPDDDFPVRSHSKLGIGEKATIIVEPKEGMENGNTVEFDSMELENNINSNGGQAVDKSGNTRIKAGDYKGTVTIKVWAKVNGVKKGPEKVDITVCEPSGVLFRKIGYILIEMEDVRIGSSLITKPGYNFGIRCNCFILPQDVSFSAISVLEDEASSNTEGSEKPWKVFKHERWEKAVGVYENTIKKGNMVKLGVGDVDNAGCVRPYSMDNKTPKGKGKFVWNIDWLFNCGDRYDVKFDTAVQTFDFSGTVLTVSKQSAKGQYQYVDTKHIIED